MAFSVTDYFALCCLVQNLHLVEGPEFMKSSTNITNFDNLISFAILFQLVAVSSKNMLSSTIRQVNDYNVILNQIISVISILIYLRCIVKTKFRVSRSAAMIILSSFTFFSMTYLFNYELFSYEVVVSDFQVFVAYCLPLILFVPLMNDVETFLNNLYKAAYLLSMVAILTFFLVLLGLDTVNVYSMSYGGAAMIPSILLFSKAFKEKTLKDFFLASFCALAILAQGSRWPLLCIGTYVICKTIGNTLKSGKMIFFYIALIATIIILAWIYYIPILETLVLILEEFGLSSRSIKLFLQGKATYDSGRSHIYERLIPKLIQSPLVGYGAFGGVVALDGTSPHHFILDTWANFGIVFGTLILFIMLYKMMKSLLLYDGTSYAELVLIYSCMIWPKVTVAGRFWSEQAVWMVVALYIFRGKCLLGEKKKRS